MEKLRQKDHNTGRLSRGNKQQIQMALIIMCPKLEFYFSNILTKGEAIIKVIVIFTSQCFHECKEVREREYLINDVIFNMFNMDHFFLPTLRRSGVY